jgi:hypothetical protein
VGVTLDENPVLQARQVSTSIAVMETALLTDDFSVKYVA